VEGGRGYRDPEETLLIVTAKPNDAGPRGFGWPMRRGAPATVRRPGSAGLALEPQGRACQTGGMGATGRAMGRTASAPDSSNRIRAVRVEAPHS
jgi:hypothetical protein